MTTPIIPSLPNEDNNWTIQNQQPDSTLANLAEQDTEGYQQNAKQTTPAKAAKTLAQNLSGGVLVPLKTWVANQSNQTDILNIEDPNKIIEITMNQIGIENGLAAEQQVMNGSTGLIADIEALKGTGLTSALLAEEASLIQANIQSATFADTPAGINTAICFILDEDPTIAAQVHSGNYSELVTALQAYVPSLVNSYLSAAELSYIVSNILTTSPSASSITATATLLAIASAAPVPVSLTLDTASTAGDNGYTIDTSFLSGALTGTLGPVTPAINGSLGIQSKVSFSINGGAFNSVTVGSNGTFTLPGVIHGENIQIKVNDNLSTALYNVSTPYYSDVIGSTTPPTGITGALTKLLNDPVIIAEIAQIPANYAGLAAALQIYVPGIVNSIGSITTVAKLQALLGTLSPTLATIGTVAVALFNASTIPTHITASLETAYTTANGNSLDFGLLSNGAVLLSILNPSGSDITATDGVVVTDFNGVVISPTTDQFGHISYSTEGAVEPLLFTVEGMTYSLTPPAPSLYQPPNESPLINSTWDGADFNYTYTPTYNLTAQSLSFGTSDPAAIVYATDINLNPIAGIETPLGSGTYVFAPAIPGETILVSVDDGTALTTYPVQIPLISTTLPTDPTLSILAPDGNYDVTDSTFYTHYNPNTQTLDNLFRAEFDPADPNTVITATATVNGISVPVTELFNNGPVFVVSALPTDSVVYTITDTVNGVPTTTVYTA